MNNYTKFNLFNYNKSKIFLIKWAENCITNFHYHPDIKCAFIFIKIFNSKQNIIALAETK